MGSKLKERFKLNQDEFMFSPHAKHVEVRPFLPIHWQPHHVCSIVCGCGVHVQELVSEATRVKFERVSEQILLMQQIVSSMLQVAHNMENRSVSLSVDMKTLSSSMSSLATDNLLMQSWTSGADDTWSYMQSDCAHLSGRFAELSEKAKLQGVRETSSYTESVHLFLDLITSYLDLCERREKTVQRKHQKALLKVQTVMSHKERMQSTGRQTVNMATSTTVAPA